MSDVLCGSHIPALIKALNQNKDPVLELGIGWSSTPLLHWVCTANKRNLMSLETDIDWLSKFTAYENYYHIVAHVKDWAKVGFDWNDWGVVLIDHRPAKERSNSAIRLKDRARIILLHDSEPEIDRFYRYGRAYKHFKYVYQYTKVKPFTAILSNFVDVERIYENSR